jgi:peptide-methionine (S)-S-oxide reductase
MRRTKIFIVGAALAVGGGWFSLAPTREAATGASLAHRADVALAASHSSQRSRPAMDLAQPAKCATATFAVGCFWSVDSRFGSLPGVVRTRCGYAGGRGDHPSYEHLQGHIESLQLDYDPALTSYSKLLDAFFDHHPCTRADSPKSHPTLFYADEQQHREALAALRSRERQLGFKPQVAVLPVGPFFVAEAYHQKYHLRENPALWKEFKEMYPGNDEQLLRSSAATRVNSYLGGFGNVRQLQKDLPGMGLSPAGQSELKKSVSQA